MNLIPSWAWWQLHRSPTRRCCPPGQKSYGFFVLFFLRTKSFETKVHSLRSKDSNGFCTFDKSSKLPKRLAAEKLIFETTQKHLKWTCVETISWLLSIDFWQSDLRQTPLSGKEFLHPTSSSFVQACCLSVRSNLCLLPSLHNVCFELLKHMPCVLLQGQCGNASSLDDFCKTVCKWEIHMHIREKYILAAGKHEHMLSAQQHHNKIKKCASWFHSFPNSLDDQVSERVWEFLRSTSTCNPDGAWTVLRTLWHRRTQVIFYWQQTHFPGFLLQKYVKRKNVGPKLHWHHWQPPHSLQLKSLSFARTQHSRPKILSQGLRKGFQAELHLLTLPQADI